MNKSISMVLPLAICLVTSSVCLAQQEIRLLPSSEDDIVRGEWVSLEKFSIVFSPDGKTLASASHWRDTSNGKLDGSIELWNVATGGHRGNYQNYIDVAFRGNGQLAAVTTEGRVNFIDLATKEEKPVPGEAMHVRFIKASPDGQTLIAVRPGDGEIWGTVYLLDMKTGENIGRAGPSAPAISAVAFSPDSETILTGVYDRQLADVIQFWNARNGELIDVSPLKGHQLPITSLVASIDGKYFASSANYKTEDTLQTEVKLWPSGAQQSIPLTGHPGQITSLAFSGDAKTVAAGGGLKRIGTVTFWDVASGQKQKTLRAHDRLVRSLAISPDGKTMASGHQDLTIKLWATTIAGPGIVESQPKGVESQPKGTDPPPSRTLILTVKDRANEPITSAKILVNGAETTAASIGGGKYRVKLRAGTPYEVTVSSDGYTPDTKSVPSGDSDETIEFALAPVVIPTVLYTLHLSITDRDSEELIGGANISIKDTHNNPVDVDPDPTTDDEGIYIFRVKPGTYALTVEKANFETKTVESIEVLERLSPHKISLAKMGAPTYALEVTVVDDGPDSIHDLKIIVDPEIEIDPDGSGYAFRVPAGRYEVSVQSPEFVFEPKIVTITSSDAELWMEPGVKEPTIDQQLKNLFVELDRNGRDGVTKDDFSTLSWEFLKLAIGKTDEAPVTSGELRNFLESRNRESAQSQATDDTLPDSTNTVEQDPAIVAKQMLADFDRDGDGAVTKNDFVDFSPLGWEVFQQVMEAKDDGKYTATDLQAFVKRRNYENQTARRARARAHMETAGEEPVTGNRARLLFQQLNTNGDQVVNQDDYPTSKIAWEHTRERFDLNGDQQLTELELDKAIESETEPPVENVDDETRGTLTIRRLAAKK